MPPKFKPDAAGIYRLTPKPKTKCHVIWKLGKFGWDAIAVDRNGRVVNQLNHGLKKPPTKRQRSSAVRKLCG